MKHTMKKLLAALLACLLLLSSVALADQTSTVSVSEGEQKTIDGNVTVSSKNASGVNATGGEVTVNGNVTASGEDGKGVKASGGKVTVNGDVQATEEGGVAVQSSGDSTVNVTGDANGYHDGVYAVGGSTVTVGGDVTGGSVAVQAKDKETKVTVEGDAQSDEGQGAHAANGSTIEVKGNVSCGMGAIAVGSTLKVGGGVTATGDWGTGVNAAEGSTVTVGTEEKPATVTSANGSGVKAAGEGTQVTVTGNVEATGDEGTGVEAYQGGEVTVNGSVEGNYTGVYAHANSYAEEKVGGTVTVTGDVSSTNGTGVEAKDGGKVDVGGSVTGGAYEKHVVDASGAGTEVKVGGNVESTTNETKSSGVNATDGAQVEVVGGVSTIQGDNAVNASGEGTKVTVGGNVTNTYYGGKAINAAGGSTVNVGGDVTGGYTGVGASSEGTEVNVTGNVTATGNGAFGVSASGGSKVTVGTEGTKDDADVGNVKGNNQGVYATGEGTEVTVYGNVEAETSFGVQATDKSTVYVTGDVTGHSQGIYMIGSGIEVTVDGDVKSTASDGIYASNNNDSGAVSSVTVHGGVESAKDKQGIWATGATTITVDGSVTGSNMGVRASGDADVTVGGDVKAAGDAGIGLRLMGRDATAEAKEGEDGVNIIVEGTVSGQDAAVEVVNKTSYSEYDTGSVKVTAWALESESEDLVRAVDISYKNMGQEVKKTNDEVSEAFVKTINYIIKLAGGLAYDNVATENENSVAIGENTYHTANEEEKVTLTVDETDGALESVWYNADKEDAANNVLTVANGGLTKNEKGGYVLSMLRGGAMKLLANFHVHKYAYVYNNDATCTADGTETGTCACGKTDTRTKTGSKLGHDYKAVVTAPTCTEKGYTTHTCSRCKDSYVDTYVDAKGHTPGEAVKEKEVAATCQKAGSYDEVVYCSVCKTELSRTAKTVDKLAHTPGAAVKENEVAATCQKEGNDEEAVYCTACKAELSRTAKTVDKLAHTPAEAVKENIVASKPGEKGHYDEVVYCSVCKEELSRKTVETEALPVVQPVEEPKTEEPKAEPKAEEPKVETPVVVTPVVETPAAEPVAEEAKTETAPAAYTQFVYVPLDDNAEVNGVKAADQLPMVEAMKAVGDHLDGESVSVEVLDSEKLMDAAQKARFDSLTVKDRLLVTLSALGFGEALGDIGEEMSEEAKSLSEDIAASVEAMSEAEKQALLNKLNGLFLPRLVVIDDQEYEAVGIEVVVTRDGEKTYNRYTFYKDGGEWKLYRIEEGEYITVNG